jgi:large subunit ribosomal protein L25
LGSEDAPGVKEGGVLEHVTRELTIEALPTDIPENIPVDVSGMDINDTLPLSALVPPDGVDFLDDEETTIATLTPPRVEEEPEPELEEEAELVGEDGEAPEGEAPGEEAPAEGGEASAEGGGEGE